MNKLMEPKEERKENKSVLATPSECSGCHYTLGVAGVPLHPRSSRGATTPSEWPGCHYTLRVAGVPLHPRSTGDAVPLDNVDGDGLVLAAGRAG